MISINALKLPKNKWASPIVGSNALF
jgi:hypothetical protein